MKRRGLMWVLGVAGLLLWLQGPVVAAPAPEKTAEELLRSALQERRMVQFWYHGYPRQVEPHALGRATEGRLALLGWQVSGGSSSEPPPGWRTFLLTEIESLKLLKPVFTVRPDYHPEATKLKPIEAEVTPAPGKEK